MEILLHITADIQSKTPFGAIVYTIYVYNNCELVAAQSDQAAQAHGPVSPADI
jgi:hypothetical protein